MSRNLAAPITDFRGLNERMRLGSSLQETTSLDNVIVRNGHVSGRKGIALWDAISTAATNHIIGLWDFYIPASATSSLVRMQTAKFEVWNDGTNAWDDITGTALTGDTDTRPSFANLSDEGFMVFTNEGKDQPRKYTGSGNSTTLGGTPPYAKWLCPYKGFLFLFNTSTDGTFSATADSITAYFSDQPDTNWDLCAGNTMIYDESPGEVRAADVFNEVMLVLKSDCLVTTRFAGGVVRFERDKLPFAHGILAPLSLKKCGEYGAIFLATDRNLYRTDGTSVVALPLNVQKALQETMTPALAPYVSACVDLTKETYHLLYKRNSSTFFDGRLSFNYRTEEFYKGVYTGRELTRIHAFKQSNNVDTQIVAGVDDKKVYELETGTDDAGTAVSRFYDLDWNQYGTPGSKYLTGVNFTFKSASNVQAQVSVAVDHSSKFQYSRMLSLKGTTNPSDENVRVDYNIPSPIIGSWFKIRIEFFHYGSANVGELLEIEPEIIPVHRTAEHESKQQIAQRA